MCVLLLLSFFDYFFFFNINRIEFALKLKSTVIKLKHICSTTANNQAKNEVRVWQPGTSRCVGCNAPRQICIGNNKKISNPDVAFWGLGENICFYLFEKYKILVNKKAILCWHCWINFGERVLQQKPWNKDSNKMNKARCFVINKNKWITNGKVLKEAKVLAAELIASHDSWSDLTKKTKKYNIVDKLLHSLEKTEPNLIRNSKYKQLTGLKKTQFSSFCKEILHIIKAHQNGSKKSVFIINGVEYIFSIQTSCEKKLIRKMLLILLMKWRSNLSNVTLAAMIQVGSRQVREYLRKITSVLPTYSDKWLVNTKKKLKKHRNVYYNYLMGIDENMDVVMGDGVRFKACKPCSFQAQYSTFDNKHGFNSFNVIGWCTIDGYYIGFYPRCGFSSDGQHADGVCSDFLILFNIENILNVITPNTYPFANDGTRCIFDRALRAGCYTLKYGIINWATPNLKLGTQTRAEANETRKQATSYRWMIEKCFGTLGNVWKIFKAPISLINSNYFDIFGYWVNAAGAICNQFRVGVPEFDEQRLLQTLWMKTKIINENPVKNSKTILEICLEKYRLKRTLKKTWIKANNIDDLVENSEWNLNKLNNYFFLAEKELAVYGGGVFSYRLSRYYLVHSASYLEVYYSNVEMYKNIIMIRNMKQKLTREYDDNGGANGEGRDDWKFHNILLARLKHKVVNIFEAVTFSNQLCYLDSCCDCVIGRRSVSVCTHVITALVFFKKWTYNIDIRPVLPSENKYENLIDISFWKKNMNTLATNQMKFYARQFCSNFHKNL